MAPDFLIGGVPADFGLSARLGNTDFFVVEADEYDTAFFDKRSKFVHYRPRTLIINNLEYDHADIFPDLAAIQRQFHHLVRTVPGEGLIVCPASVPAIEQTLEQGCWTGVCTTAIDADGDWSARLLEADGSVFEISLAGEAPQTVRWEHCGAHNVANALAAMAAARHVGVLPSVASEALACFGGVKRRLELLGTVNGVSVYDDFAHHPTAIQKTISALRERYPERRLWICFEPRSNTTRRNVFQKSLPEALAGADHVVLTQVARSDQLKPEERLDPEAVIRSIQQSGTKAEMVDNPASIPDRIGPQLKQGDVVAFFSNGSFGGAIDGLIDWLNQRR
jgi:UDP-N-acetylmuramate: L-alanyl-gamma-D-glutamyl-meso-diaminopimelate ligase